MNNWLKIVQHWGWACLSLSTYCVLCLKRSEDDLALCQRCQQVLPWLDQGCRICALPIKEGEVCGQCLQHSPVFDEIKALFHYAWPVNRFISKLKYSEQLHYARLLGKLMAAKLSITRPIDCIIPMPLHPKRQRKRGFNQTLELASIIAKQKNIPLDRWSCTRQLDTLPQSALSAKERKANFRAHTFQIAKGFQAKHVLVIEDVVTTKASVIALTTALKRANVATVEIWACCRTPL